MGYYDFPHTRNYDTDLGYLIDWFKTNKNKIEENTAITIEKALSASEDAIKAANSATSASNSAISASNSAKLIIDTIVYVTPEMYGAVGDGINDDTNAIKEAIETGNTIIFKAGKKYIVNDTIYIPSSKRLIGNGCELHSLQSTNYEGCVIAIKGSNIVIDDFILSFENEDYPFNVQSTNMCCIGVGGTIETDIKGIIISNIKSNASYIVSIEDDNHTIKNVVIDNLYCLNGVVSYKPFHENGVDEISITNSTIGVLRAGDSSIYVNSFISDCKIEKVHQSCPGAQFVNLKCLVDENSRVYRDNVYPETAFFTGSKLTNVTVKGNNKPKSTKGIIFGVIKCDVNGLSIDGYSECSIEATAENSLFVNVESKGTNKVIGYASNSLFENNTGFIKTSSNTLEGSLSFFNGWSISSSSLPNYINRIDNTVNLCFSVSTTQTPNFTLNISKVYDALRPTHDRFISSFGLIDNAIVPIPIKISVDGNVYVDDRFVVAIYKSSINLKTLFVCGSYPIK